ncbi:3S-6E-nerolidol synthase 1 [Nymphaea thermarum]|nr:3S-6E-nerolidol synthase 1 [Nymphaea thermarum]
MGTNDELELVKSINSLHRFDIAYHFAHEIEAKLISFYHKFGGSDTSEHNLHTVALQFRLFRQQGFYVSPDVFRKFKDFEGGFNVGLAKDSSGLMSFYEASYFECPGEDILDEAKVFAKTHLEALIPLLHPSPANQTRHVLEHPLRFTLPRIGARNYIERSCEDQDMVELAILEFNYVQSLHQRDLQEFSKWWEELGIIKEMGFLTRNQPVLWFMLSTLALPEPQCSRLRIEFAKLTALIFVIDDLFDVYGDDQLDDLVLFVEAINSWDTASVEQLPRHMKLCFSAFMNVLNGIRLMVLTQNGCDILQHSKATSASLCKAFLREVRWLKSQSLPSTKEYLDNATTTSGLLLVLTHFYFLMHQQVPMEQLGPTPSLIFLPAAIFRLWDDLGSSKVERDRGYDASYVEFYAKEHNVSEEYARKETLNLIDDAWKKLNQASLQSGLQGLTPAFIRLSLNCARLGQLLYSFGKDDQETTMKENVKKIFIEKISC